jgi:hypothetical protein
MDSTIISELDFSHDYHDLARGFLKRKTSRNQGLTWNNRRFPLQVFLATPREDICGSHGVSEHGS